MEPRVQVFYAPRVGLRQEGSTRGKFSASSPEVSWRIAVASHPLIGEHVRRRGWGRAWDGAPRREQAPDNSLSRYHRLRLLSRIHLSEASRPRRGECFAREVNVCGSWQCGRGRGRLLEGVAHRWAASNCVMGLQTGSVQWLHICCLR